MENQNVCSLCNIRYSSYGNLNKHMKNVHQITPKAIVDNITAYDVEQFISKCLDGCEVSFKSASDLTEHLKVKHNYIIPPVEELEFSSYEDFDHWLQNEQLKQDAQYIRTSKKKREEEDIIYYKCNRTSRSDYLKNKPLERKRKLKSQGYSKLERASCISYLVLRINKATNKCNVRYNSYHYGHIINIEHLKINKIHKEVIASKLTQGVPVPRILSDIRNNVSTESLSRLDLATRKDIQNIKHSFNISVQDGQRHINDAISVDLLVEEYFSSERNPIVLYKKPGSQRITSILQDTSKFEFKPEDICFIMMDDSQIHILKTFGKNIICIDSTHGTNGYDYELTTVLVVDDFGEGFPCAFMWSNRKDTIIFQYFFSAIAAVAGVIECKVFMTDICNSFYNAWVSVMGMPNKQLYCSWHIDKAWQQNLSKISGENATDTKEKRDHIYKMCKTLQAITDISEFKMCYTQFLAELLKDKHTQSFYKYFTSGFNSKPELWAYCYRKDVGINTNMYIESMHRTIKYEYLEGKKVRRLDKAIYCIERFLRDKEFERVIKLKKGKITNRVRTLTSRHQQAIETVFKITIISNTKWEVLNEQSAKTYIVENVQKFICCSVTCDICEICLHSFHCTCTDYGIHSIICKHIHYLHINKYCSASSSDAIHLDQASEINIHLQNIVKKQPATAADLQKQIQNELSSISLLTSNISNTDNLNIALKFKKNAKAVLTPSYNTNRSSITQSVFPELNKEPSNKKIEKQVFFSTKMKPKSLKCHLRKPSIKEQQNITASLKNEGSLIVTEPLAEHNYTL